MAWHGSAALPSSPCPERPRRLAPLRRFPPVSTAAVRCALRTPLAGLAIQRCDALLVISGLRMAGLIAALLTELLTGFCELPTCAACAGRAAAGGEGAALQGRRVHAARIRARADRAGWSLPSIDRCNSLGAACAANGRHSPLCALVSLSLFALYRSRPSFLEEPRARISAISAWRADGPRHRQRVHPRQPGEESRALVGSP